MRFFQNLAPSLEAGDVLCLEETSAGIDAVLTILKTAAEVGTGLQSCGFGEENECMGAMS